MRRPGFTLDVSPLLGGVALLTIAVIEMQPNYSAPAILWLAPALLILAVLSLGRYPGESILARLVRSPPPRPRRAERRPPPVERRAPSPRGGELISTGLAGRAPPASIAV